MTVSLTITAADGAIGNVLLPAPNVVTSTLTDNGKSGAPAGAPQFPSLFANYKVRPPFNAPGADYRVGFDTNKYPTTASMKNPMPNGLSGKPDAGLGPNAVYSNDHRITINDNNVTVEGYDFSLNGGLLVYAAANNITIDNCYFKIGANARGCIGMVGAGLMVTNCELDGGGINTNPAAPLIQFYGTGSMVLRYCYLHSSYYQHVQFSFANPSNIFQYNLFVNSGFGGAGQGAHGDWIMQAGGNFPDIEVNGNVFIQNTLNTVAQTQGISLCAVDPSLTTTFNVINNVLISTGGTGGSGTGNTNYLVIMYEGGWSGVASVKNNYCDPTSCLGFNNNGNPWLFNGTAKAGSSLVVSGNINMLNGASLDAHST
jgi:hypothetical protein